LVSAARLAPTSVVDPIADAAFDEAIAIYRDLKRTRRLAWALLWRGRMLGQREPARARPYLEESLTLFRDCGDLLGVSWALYALSMAAWELGNDELSRVLIAELHDLAEAQVPAALSLALSRSAFAALTAGDDADALRLIGAAEAHDREGNRSNLLGTLYNRSWIESQVGSRQRALEALREALELDRIIGPGDPRIPALLAAELLVDQQPAAAREVLASAGLLHGEFGPFPERWARERASKIAARLDLTEPATGRFQNFMDALDWILEWVSGAFDDAMPEP
jgi:tetratricopeptide (TPR) repeat protein